MSDLDAYLDAATPPSVDAKEGRAAVKKIAAELYRRLGDEALAELGRLRRISMWQTTTKDADGNAHTHDLHGFQLAPSWDEGPQWPVVQPAAPVRISRPKAKARPANGSRVTVILPDPQIGFRRLSDGEMITMHDPAAMDVSLAVAAAASPDSIVYLGDHMDFAEWSSKFVPEPEFVLTTQPAIDEGSTFLARGRAICDDVKLLGGNHDARLGLAVTRNAQAALRLRRANTPDSWPVLSLPSLLRLDDLGVQYVGAYPAGRVKVTSGNDEHTPLYAIHGEKLDVVKVAKAERQSFTQGHIHRRSSHTETYEVDGRPLLVTAFSPGCLCRIDGAVPSTKGGTDDHGRPALRWENWQQGMAVVIEHDDGSWDHEIVPIHRGRALWRGRTYDAA